MKYRAYNEKNYSERLGGYFHTFFRTKREAIAWCEAHGGGKIERKIGGNWFPC